MRSLFPRAPYIIAEAGVNHNGDLRRARSLVETAAECGADAVKFQTFKAEFLVTAGAPKAGYQRRRAVWKGARHRGNEFLIPRRRADPKESQLQMLKKLELPPAAHAELAALCRRRGLDFLSTPFDEDSADLLARLGVKYFKVPSGDITHTRLLAHISRKGRPVLLSTGMSTLDEVAAAVRTIKENGNPPLVLLHCVSNYPADPKDANLRAMKTMADRFNVSVGYSDHTPGVEVAVAAAALGAVVIEKHLTLDKELPGPDHRMSLDPKEFRELVRAVRSAASALGDGLKAPRPSEAALRKIARRSLVLAKDTPAGARLSEELVAAKRPGTGIPADEIGRVLGRRLRRDAAADTLLRWSMLA